MRSFRSLLLVAAALVFSAAASASAQDAQSRLWDASISGDTAAIRHAVKEGARVDSLDTRTNPNGRYALNWAAWNNRVDAVKLLLELKAPLNAANVTGFTALHHAAENGSADAAKVLLEAGADFTLINKGGMTALDVAQARGNDGVAGLIGAAASKKVK